MKQVTFRGTGQLNGPVIINKTIELEDQIANSLLGAKKNEVKLAILENHFPGVKINPSQIGCEVKEIKKKKTPTNSTNNKRVNKSSKSSFTISSIILFLLFWPFKLAWWFIKKIWKEDHV